MGKVATSPLPTGGSPPLPSGGQHQRWPTGGQGGYITPAGWGGPHRFRTGGCIKGGPQVGKVATSHLPPGGVPTASQRRAASEVAHKWARWLHNPCCLRGSPQVQSGGQHQRSPTNGRGGYITPAGWGGPDRFRAGGSITGGQELGKVATSPLPPGGSPLLQSGELHQRWPTSGQGGYITPAAWGFPTASEQGAALEVAHKWARGLHNPCRLGGSPPLQSGGEHQKWPAGGQGGYITPAARGVPTASERGAASEVAHKRAMWRHNPCRRGGPQHFRAGHSIRGGPQGHVGHGSKKMPGARLAC